MAKSEVQEMVDAPEGEVRAVLMSLCNDQRVRRKALANWKLVRCPLTPNTANEPNRGTKRKATSDILICVQCDEYFFTDDNTKKGCNYHFGELECDYDSPKWIDWDERCHGPEDSEENREAYPDGFTWTCCDKEGGSSGCAKGRHEANPDLSKKGKDEPPTTEESNDDDDVDDEEDEEDEEDEDDEESEDDDVYIQTAEEARESIDRKIQASSRILNQYYQGENVAELDSSSRGDCEFISPVHYYDSPFSGQGFLETIKGTQGPGSGSIVLRKGPHVHTPKPEEFVVPVKHIEQVIVVPDAGAEAISESGGLCRVVIVPTAATGGSGATKALPRIIQFTIPNQKAGKLFTANNLTKESGPGPEGPEVMYPTILKFWLDRHLAPLGKSVVMYKKGIEAAEASSKMFRYRAEISGRTMKEIAKGLLFFLPTGILWLSKTSLYLPFNSIGKLSLIFVRDLASKTKNNSEPIVAMGAMIPVSEPFYEAKGEKPSQKLLHFQNIENFQHSRYDIQEYAETHGFGFEKLEQSFYNWEKREMMSGYMLMRES
ncbi:hypothetical protein G7046_g8877 [Stylonectria norvegica]|nr:hypothetical protein G7046_g8877 [Stylonectria norvegica]